MAQLTIEIDEHSLATLEREARTKNIPVNKLAAYDLEKLLFGIPRRLAIPFEKYVPQHIPVMVDNTLDEIEKPFRCSICGNTVFKYYGGVKLIMNGHYDSDNNMIDGEEINWFKKLGIPDTLECSGRVFVQYADGRTGKIRCRTTYYRIGV